MKAQYAEMTPWEVLEKVTQTACYADEEASWIKKDASGRACWCKDGQTCEPCLSRAAKRLLKAISERESEVK